MNYKKFLLLVVGILSANLFAQNSSIDSTLNEIELLYNNGQYVSAELEARRMTENTDLNDSTKVILEKWIAFSLIAQGKSSAARERFISLLKIDETFELDAVLTSPKILSVFNDARTKFLSQKRNFVADSMQHNSIKQQIANTSISYRTIVFPGWEQLHQGRTTNGYIFLGAGAMTFTSGIVFEFLRSSARNDYLAATNASEISSKYDTYNTYRKAEMYSFSLFALTYILSEIDVFSHSSLSIQPSISLQGNSEMRMTIRF